MLVLRNFVTQTFIRKKLSSSTRGPYRILGWDNGQDFAREQGDQNLLDLTTVLEGFTGNFHWIACSKVNCAHALGDPLVMPGNSTQDHI